MKESESASGVTGYIEGEKLPVVIQRNSVIRSRVVGKGRKRKKPTNQSI